MKKVFMFVNVDWFFQSHRRCIANAANNNNINMSVYTDFTYHHKASDQTGFKLIQSPIGRSSKYIGAVLVEFIKCYLLILKLKPDLIHAVTIKPMILMGIVARLTGTRFVAAVSGLGPVFAPTKWHHKFRLKLVIFVYRYIFKARFSAIICQSEHDKSVLLKYNVCSEFQVSIIEGSGVDLDRYSPDNSTEKLGRYVLMASRILADKGVREFCQSAKDYIDNGGRGINFKLAGPIDYISPTSISEDEIRQLCQESGVDYLGNRDDLDVLLSSALIFVLPSYYPEGIPKVLLEAAACGTPVITTNHPGCRDAVEDSVTGILVQPRDSKALSVAIADLLSKPEVLSSMSMAARKMAIKRFDERKVIEAHYQIYNRFLDDTVD